MKTFSEHFGELKKTVLSCLIISAIGAGIAYFLFSDELMDLLTMEIRNLEVPIIYTSVTESFATEMKAGLIAGIICVFPINITVIWRFFAPAFLGNERRKIILYTLVSILLFTAGLAFGYFILFPFVLRFFLESVSGTATAMISVDSYIKFLCRLTFPFGLIAEMPLAETVLISHGIVSVKTLGKLRKYIFLICMIMGAILTPPDVVSQLCVAFPMYVLYECGLIAGRISQNKKHTAESV